MFTPDSDLNHRLTTAIDGRARALAEECADYHSISAHAFLRDLQREGGSPIELLLGAHFFGMSDGYNPVIYVPAEVTVPSPRFGTRLTLQQPVGAYRADFGFCCFLHEQKRYLAVECDGHDFHEKTKEQVMRDKRRDRFFLSRGVLVLRFSGTEIFNDPRACGDEVSAALQRVIGEMMAVQGLAS